MSNKDNLIKAIQNSNLPAKSYAEIRKILEQELAANQRKKPKDNYPKKIKSDVKRHKVLDENKL